MPSESGPAHESYAEDAINALRNDLDVTILGYVRKNPRVTRAMISDALQIPRVTVSKGIERLIGADLLLADPPREEATRGQWVVYTVNEPQLTEMMIRLSQALGQF